MNNEQIMKAHDRTLDPLQLKRGDHLAVHVPGFVHVVRAVYKGMPSGMIPLNDDGSIDMGQLDYIDCRGETVPRPKFEHYVLGRWSDVLMKHLISLLDAPVKIIAGEAREDRILLWEEGRGKGDSRDIGFCSFDVDLNHVIDGTSICSMQMLAFAGGEYEFGSITRACGGYNDTDTAQGRMHERMLGMDHQMLMSAAILFRALRDAMRIVRAQNKQK